MFGKNRTLSIMLGILVLCCLNASADLSEIVDGKIEQVATGFQFTEGPVWHPDGYLLFSDIPANRIIKWTAVNTFEVFREPSGNSNGLALDMQGQLIACETSKRRVSRTRKNGTIVTLAEKFEGKRLNSPNDLAIRSDGSIYFSDPGFGTPEEQKELAFQGVYRISPGGKLFLEAKEGFEKPNGLAFSPDENILYVDDSQTGLIQAFDVGSDGSLKNGRRFAEIPAKGLDGAKVDSKGNLYVTAANGISVFNPSGKLLGIIPIPEVPSNLAFGDPDFKTLYITAQKSLYRMRMKNEGFRPVSAKIKESGSGEVR
ncbi:MAG TPA: SMP-30/gluconolactonase/LRE family protein [bacterium]|nr:SMP-30/gluconolactonase/LRE family protein [bacterium]HQL60833.1 SMP-30/gluconolactonase/LRE family protein [bacterium]